MEDDNRRASHAVDEAPEEVRHVGERASHRRQRGHVTSEGVQIRDVQGAYGRPTSSPRFAVAGLWEAQEGAVAESGRVEPASRSLHKEVQRGHEIAETGIVESIQRDDQPWSPVLKRRHGAGGYRNYKMFYSFLQMLTLFMKRKNTKNTKRVAET